MKITAIKTHNFLSLADFSVKTSEPVVLFCGHNEVGKTSLANAISFALTGQPRRADIAKKKDLPLLVTHGQRTGNVEVKVKHNDQAISFERAITTGIGSQSNVDDPFMRCCLDMHLFSSLNPDERRKLLFSSKPDFKRVKELATKQFSCKAEILDEYRSWIESGFEEALEKLRDDVHELKGEWKGVTGEAWGIDKGDRYEYKLPPQPKGQEIENYRDEIKIYSLEVSRLTNQKLTIQRKIAEIEGQNKVLAELRKDARLDVDYKKLLEDLDDQYVIAQEKVFSGRQHMEGVMTCPHCSNPIAISHGKVIAVKISKDNSAEKALQILEEKIKQVADESIAAEKARERLEEINKDIPDLQPLREEIERIDKSMEGNVPYLEETKAKLAELERQKEDESRGKEITERAHEIHQRIIERIAVGKAFGSDGVPRALGANKLDQINQILRDSAKQSGWRTVRVTEDGDILADEEPYFLLSESAQWRADAQLTVAIGKLSGWRLAVLDRMDVLDIQGRGKAMRWIMQAHRDMDSIIIMATMKEQPKINADWLKVVWMER